MESSNPPPFLSVDEFARLLELTRSRKLTGMSEEEVVREGARIKERVYEILGISEERVRKIVQQLTGRELYECIRQTKLDRRAHILRFHPEEDNAPTPEDQGPVPQRTVETFLNNFMYGLAERPSPHRRELLVSFLSSSVSLYWSHVTEGHVASGGSAENYLKSLTQRSAQEAWTGF